MNTDNTTILNIERSAPTGGGRTFSHINRNIGTERKLRVAAYCRVSSGSAEQMNSYASQMRHYAAVIGENPDWELADIYADEAETGLSTANRTDFRRMMRDCRQGKIDRILCKSVSRFARNYSDCIESIRELKKLGVSVLFEKEGIDTSKMTSEMFLSLQALKAQRESMSISGNMKRGVRMRMKSGAFISPSTPYGYRLNGRTLEPIPEEAAVVRRIFAAYLSGKGLSSIASELTAERVQRRFGNTRWRPGTVSYILTNIAYTGDALWQKKYTTDTLPLKLLPNRGERPQYYVANDHEAIVSREDFEKARTLLAERRERFVTDERPERLFARKIFCGGCGSSFRYKVCGGVPYWQCRRRDANKSLCPVTQVPESAILSAFGRMSDKLRHYADYVIAPMLERLEDVSERRQRGNVKLSEINRELAELAGQLHALNRLNGKGVMDSALFIEKSNALNKKLSDARQTKSRLLAEDNRDDRLQAVSELLNALKSDMVDDELFAESVEKITVGADDALKFRLKCGLELTETVERAVRFGGVAAQDALRLYGG
jgi:DNA invertase Pin-like site-specific DNA recombinase